ncbi:hypothetical protein M9458_042369, partial [Cirrhinus mrigala]
YWVFDAERQITGPDSVRRLGLTVTDIQAALIRSTSSKKEATGDSTSRKTAMRDWRGVPDDIDAAFQDRF